MITAYIAIGSNHGPRLRHVEIALARLEGLGDVCRLSPLYLTEPVAVEGGWFINGIAEMRTTKEPTVLLQHLLDIERQLGRVRGETPRRTIDLDIVFYGQEVIKEHGLTIPHPRAHERRFVLQPLVDLCPDYVHPIEKKSVKQLLHELEDPAEVHGIERRESRYQG
jgi:2-amino-4-hydroxy-6-hydroxymethyldihydropteridine diphosphokinase